MENNLLSTSQTVLAAVILDENIARKVFPYLKTEYFNSLEEQLVYNVASSYFVSYSALPPREAMAVELSKLQGVNEAIFQRAVEFSQQVHNTATVEFLTKVDHVWLLNTAETFVKERAIHLAIMDSISVLDDKPVKGKKLDRGAIPQLLQEALSISFDPSIGHDIIDDAEKRYDFYHSVEKRIKTGIREIDKVTNGGLPIKSLTVFVSPTGIGKSTIMSSIGVDMFLRGENVLYVTAEMAEEKIGERVDANMLDLRMAELALMQKQAYTNRIARIAGQSKGKFIIKEYPTSSASVTHIRSLLNDLRLKKKFVPTIVFVDYLNIFASARFKSADNTYSYMKSVAEELRGLAVEFNVPVVTATQTNRAGMGATDYDLTEISESVGVSHTADLMLALISTEQLEQMGQIQIKQLKNRFGAIDQPRKFNVGIDRSKMRLFNLNEEASRVQQITSQSPAESTKSFDKVSFGFKKNKADTSQWTT